MAAGCGSKVQVSGTASGGDGGAAGAATSSASQGGGSSTTDVATTGTAGSTSTTTDPCDPGGTDSDLDQDGFTEDQGDCNDCEPLINPNAVDYPNMLDDDCDGEIDEPILTCDTDIELATIDPAEVARALELCKKSTGAQSYGLVQARWTMTDGSPLPNNILDAYHLGHGVLGDFGPNVLPRAGKSLVAFSSGTARRPNDPGFDPSMGINKGYESAAVDFVPGATPLCPGVLSGSPHDAVALEVEVRVPSNAQGIGFSFNFFSVEFPGVCTVYDDAFFAFLSPVPAGSLNGNIAFDSMGNPVTTNNAYFNACDCDMGPPCLAGGKMFSCELGTNELLGNGFGPMNGNSGGAATGWLNTVAPVSPNGVITLRWGVFDASDGNATTTTLVDAWRWIYDEGVGMGLPDDPGK